MKIARLWRVPAVALLFASGFPAGAQQRAAAPAAAPARHGIDPADMDPAAKPCDDYYQYADGGWMKKNPIPPEFPAWGSFNELRERNRTAMRQILERLAGEKHPAGSEEQKLGDFYASCMDETAIEAAGARPIAPELARIEKIATRADLDREIARLHELGVRAVFHYGSQQDRRNSAEVIGGLTQAGLGMPDRDYYTKTDEKSKKLRDQYVEHVRKTLVLAGDDPQKAVSEASAVLALETKLAEASMTRVERRDADANYHRMKSAEVAQLVSNLDWPGYMRAVGSATDAINVGQPKFFEAINGLLASVPLEDWKAYLRWHVAAAAAPGLSSKFVQEDFDFNSRILQGTKEMQARWKRCVNSTDAHLGFALGKLYVAENFPPHAKARADEMIKNLVAALRDDLATLSWMGPETRKAAVAKLEAFSPKIGYPDKWRDYTPYKVDRASYEANVRNGAAYEFRRDLDKIGKPVDRTEWGMTPPTVNAYYNAGKNEIVFPAGILQPPFFDAQADDAVNYGGIGAVIGHEMTHGFDDQGRKFDAEGNLKNWWTADDLKNYEQRAACVQKQFDGYVVQGDVHTNGKLVLGESIADLGGLTVAHAAYRKSLEGKPAPAPIDGLTGDQRFFLSWAHVWASNETPEFQRLQINTNPHPLGKFRAIGAPSNLPAFAKAFSCKPGDAMIRVEACQIW